jgi:hypothetical protein
LWPSNAGGVPSPPRGETAALTPARILALTEKTA